ncbi:MAG: hypothetical protein U9M89_01125 [Patescibacteria group bacterium]|nr:hypothetical protein [Patescibacteria group bacterium]
MAHKADLEDEGFEVRDDMTIDLEKYFWTLPDKIVPNIKEQPLLDEASFSVRVKY